MSEYIIPRQAFCNRYVTICDPENRYRILGHPVCINDEKYKRNEFMFNFCIVIGTEDDKIPYEAVVRRLASTFTEMEIQNQFLSEQDSSKSRDRRSISALIEIIKEDLNNYNECMIPVGEYCHVDLVSG
jgi:nitrogen permease regulator 2-like protein